MIGPLSRIIARYAAAMLVTVGWLSPELGDSLAADPDVIMVIGLGLGLATEGFYALAKKLGWAT